MPKKKKKHGRVPEKFMGYSAAVTAFDKGLASSNLELATVLRFYDEVPDNLYLGANFIYHKGGIKLVKRSLGKNMTKVLDQLFCYYLGMDGFWEVLFLLSLDRYRACFAELVAIMIAMHRHVKGEFLDVRSDSLEIIIESKSDVVKCMFEQAEGYAGNFAIMAWRFFLLHHYSLVLSLKNKKLCSLQCVALVNAEIKRVTFGVTLLLSHSNTFSSLLKLEAFCALAAIRNLKVLELVLKNNLISELRFGGDILKLEKAFENWPEGIAFTKANMPVFRFGSQILGAFRAKKQEAEKDKQMKVVSSGSISDVEDDLEKANHPSVGRILG